MNRWALVGSAVSWLVLQGASSFSVAHAESLVFRRTTGSEKVETAIELTRKDDGFTVKKHNTDEDVTVVAGRAGATQTWTYENRKLMVQLSGVRRGNTIHVTGRIDGKGVSEAVEIDAAPWFQEVGFSLRDFVLSSSQACTFWIVNPQDASAHKMKLKKVGVETVTVAGQSVPAVKTEMTVDSTFLGLFWSAYHWHRQSDGLFVQYRGKGISPTSPDTFVQAVRLP